MRTWRSGGIGLIAAGVLGMLQISLIGAPGSLFLGLGADLFYAAGVMVLAIGLTPTASVVARRPLGVAAMSVVAAWPLCSRAAGAWLSSDMTQAPGSGWTVLGSLDLVVPLAAGLIAAVQIARAGMVDAPWKWAPLWVLGLQVFASVVPQIVFVAADPADAHLYLGLFPLLGTSAFLAGTLGLGVLALLLASRGHSTTVEVFRSR